jgi:hypothetical protein
MASFFVLRISFSWVLDTVPSSWPSHLPAFPVPACALSIIWWTDDGCVLPPWFQTPVSIAMAPKLIGWLNGQNGVRCLNHPCMHHHRPSTDHLLNASIIALHRALLFRWRNHQSELSSRFFRICHWNSSHVPFPGSFACLDWCPDSSHSSHTCEWNA